MGGRREVRGGLPRTDELRGRGGRGDEVVEDHERAETEAYPPREVRLVQPRNPEGEAEDGEVDLLLLLRRVGVGGADEGGGEGAATGLGRWRCRALAERSGGRGEKVGGAVERRCAGVERHGVAAGRGELDWFGGLVVASRDSTLTIGLLNKKLRGCFLCLVGF